jgi:hypothetical protein
MSAPNSSAEPLCQVHACATGFLHDLGLAHLPERAILALRSPGNAISTLGRASLADFVMGCLNHTTQRRVAVALPMARNISRLVDRQRAITRSRASGRTMSMAIACEMKRTGWSPLAAARRSAP